MAEPAKFRNTAMVFAGIETPDPARVGVSNGFRSVGDA